MEGGEVAELDERISRTLFCKGLTQQVTQSMLYELFLIAGPIQCIHLPRARPTEAKEADGQKKVSPKSDEAVEGGCVVKKPPAARHIVGESYAIEGCAEERDAAYAGDDLFLYGRDHSLPREDVRGTSLAATVTNEGNIKDQDEVVVASDVIEVDEKPYSIEDKILYRHRVGEHQGFAFVLFCHVQSVDYAIKIFRGTKLFGSQLSMNPAMQAMEKQKALDRQMALATLPEKGSNATKCKTDLRPRSMTASGKNNSSSYAKPPDGRRERRVSKRNPLFENDQVAFDNYHNSASWNSARIAQNVATENYYLASRFADTSYGNRRSYHNVEQHDTRTAQENWRARPYNQQGRDVIPRDAVSSGDQLQWRGGCPRTGHEDLADSFGSMNIAAPRPQKMRGVYGNQRQTVLHAAIPQLGRGNVNRSQPIIESATFLPLTPNSAPSGTDRRPEMAPPPVARRREACQTVNPLCSARSEQMAKPKSKSPLLTLSADERLPILFYKCDTQPDVQTFSNNVHAGSENWDDDDAGVNRDVSTPGQRWHGGAEQLPQSRLSGHQPRYGNSPRYAYNNVQSVYPNQPYAQTDCQGYGGPNYGQWPPAPCVHDNNYYQSPQQVADQLHLLNLGHNSGRVPAEARPTSYTNQRDPSMMGYSEYQAPAYHHAALSGIEPRSYRGHNTDEYPHRTRSSPCHVTQFKREEEEEDYRRMFPTKATRSSPRLKEPTTNGHWVSPVTWQNSQTHDSPKQYGAQNKGDRANRPSMYFSPSGGNKPVYSPKPGPSRRSERGYLLSECFDNAFEAYHQGSAVNSPRVKPAGGSSRKSNAV